MDSKLKEKAYTLLKKFKGEKYLFGMNIAERAGEFVEGLGKRVLIISDSNQHLDSFVNKVVDSLKEKELSIAGDNIVPGASPNAPREDVYRIESSILHYKPDFLIAIGGGSTIDAVKAANVLATLGKVSNDIETYFGTGQVTKLLNENNKKLYPMVAIQTAASSSAHLTKYSNVTDPVDGQKKLIVDEAIIPDKSIFDYQVTKTAPEGLTADGALDGIAHSLEVFYGINEEKYDQLKEIACTGIELIVNNLVDVIDNPGDNTGREALGLGTDLGGYSIMVGGTNGGHLTSFSLVDVTSHGRACAIMNPYYTVFFAPAIEKQLKEIGFILENAGLINKEFENKKGKELGIVVAEGMIELSKKIGFPTKLEDLPDFEEKHIERALKAAKNPQLDMKLKNMPVALNASLVDEYMRPILEAARTGDFEKIKIKS